MLAKSRDERGSILPLTVFLVVVVLAFTAFAVDLGIKRVARSDMQAMADVVALDLARQMEGRTRAAIEADPTWLQARNRSVARNKTSVGSTPVATPELGKVNAATGAFSVVGPTEVPTAVRVTAGTSVKFTFVTGSGKTARSAIATVDAQACFVIGGYAAALNSAQSPLLRALNVAGVDLTVIGSGGIATIDSATVPLLGLATALGVGTPAELTNLNVSLLTFVKAAATAIGSSNTAAVTALNALALELSGLPPMKVGDILGLESGDNSALGLGVNALDLITAALFVAGKGHAVAIPGVTINLPGLATLGIVSTIIEPPKIACGRPGKATAHSAQIRLALDGDVLKVLTGLANAKLHVGVTIADAVGKLSSIRCNVAGSGPRLVVDTSSGVAGVNVGLTAKLLGLVGLDIQVGPSSVAPRGPQPVTLQFALPPSTALPKAQMTGSLSSLGLSSLTPKVTLTPDLLGLVSALLTGVLDLVLKPILAALDGTLAALLAPVLDLVGIRLGGAEVSAAGLPSCNSPQLNG